MRQLHLVRPLCALVAVMAVPSLSYGDRRAPAATHVFASSNGYWYARTSPASTIACTEGTTKVFRVNHFGRGDGEDQLTYEFDWYGRRLFLIGIGGDLSIVRLGCWPGGRRASHAQLLLTIYWNGKEIRSFSTLDIAGEPDNVQASVSHHRVLSAVHGFQTRWSEENQKAIVSFEVQTIDGRTLAFDLQSGAVSDAEVVGVPIHEFALTLHEDPRKAAGNANDTDP